MTHNPISDREEQILAGAERVIAAKGYANTRVDDIALEAGVGKGTIYHYFSSKQEVIISLIEARLTRQANKLEEGLAKLDSIEAMLEYWIHEEIGQMLRHVGLIRAMMESGDGLPPKYRRRMHKHKDRLHKVWAAALERFLPEREVGNPTVVAAVVDGTVKSLALDALIRGEDICPTKLSREIIALLLPGILKPYIPKKD